MLHFVGYTYLTTFQKNELRRLSLNFLSLKSNEIRSFETSVTANQPTESNIPEEVLLRHHRYENLKCHLMLKRTEKSEVLLKFHVGE